jgi:hypothetical protein
LTFIAIQGPDEFMILSFESERCYRIFSNDWYVSQFFTIGTEKNNLKEKRFILAPSFSPWSSDSIAVGLWRDRRSWQLDQSCLPHGGQEAEGERQEVTVDKLSFQGTLPMTYFLQVGPTSYLPPPPNNAFIL